MLGVSKPTIWYWENDQARPRPKSIGALAAVLEVAVDELVPAEWAADVPAASSATQALNEVVRACKLQIADAAGTSPEKVDISIHL
jgi:transcriptional regulator with XRE-family HTH domain